MSRSPRVAAIDVGSNTIHLLLASCRPNTPPRQLFRRREFVQLGLDVTACGRIGPERLELAARTLTGQVAEARLRGARQLAVGATQALRAAANGKEVARLLAERAGIPEVVVLPAAEEAQLAFSGATMTIPQGTLTLLLDIGGASTQVALGPAGGACSDHSLPVGSGSIAALAAGDPPSPEEWRAMQRRVSELIPDLVPPPPRTLSLGTGGTITNLPRLIGREKGSSLRLRDVEEVIEIFREHPAWEVAARTAMDLERVRLCRGGALILAHLMDLLGLARIRCSERGLRDGMVAGILKQGDDWWRPMVPALESPLAEQAELARV